MINCLDRQGIYVTQPSFIFQNVFLKKTFTNQIDAKTL